MLLEQRVFFTNGGETRAETIAYGLSRVVDAWGPQLTEQDAWRNVGTHSQSRWILNVVSKMNSDSEMGQSLLRKCGLGQALHRQHFATRKISKSIGATSECDVH
jgi:hypothetical protein